MPGYDWPHAPFHLPSITAHLQRCTNASTCAKMGAESKDQGCRGARAATARTHRWYRAPQRLHASVLSCGAAAEPTSVREASPSTKQGCQVPS